MFTLSVFIVHRVPADASNSSLEGRGKGGALLRLKASASTIKILMCAQSHLHLFLFVFVCISRVGRVRQKGFKEVSCSNRLLTKVFSRFPLILAQLCTLLPNSLLKIWVHITRRDVWILRLLFLKKLEKQLSSSFVST